MRFCNAITLLSLPLLSIAAPLESLYPTNGYEVGLFYVNWAIYARQHFVTDLPSDKLTKVTYAFANVSSETGEVFLSDVWADTQFLYPSDTAYNDTASNRTVLRGNLNQLYKLKQQNRNLKTILSVGGWSFRQNFPTALATHATRTRFAESSLKLIADLGLDGFDIDWEYPETAADAANFIATAKLCRETYDSYAAQHANGYHFDLTISAPAGPKRYTVLPVREMDPFIDSWNLMAFDYMGPGFSNFTGHNANVYPSKDKPWTTDFNTEQAIEYYKENVVDSRKIVLGMPLYGRSFANTAGLGKPFNGTGRGSFEAGVLDFKVLPLDNSTVRTDHKLMASYSYDHNRREFVTFDTIAVQKQKTGYLKQQGLGGAWWWESSGDRTGEGSAVAAVGEQLGGQAGLKKQRNNLYYPLSKYENIRAFQGYY